MAVPADEPSSGLLRELADRLLGPSAAQPDRVRAVADDLVARGKLSREDATELVAALGETAGRGPGRLTERAAGALDGVAEQLGLVRERQLLELELRVAQLEHRLRLLELQTDARPPVPPAP